MTQWISIIMAVAVAISRVGLCAMKSTGEFSNDPENSPPPAKNKVFGNQEATYHNTEHSSHPPYTQEDNGVEKVYFDTDVPLRIDCPYPKTHRHVIWERTDLIYPLAVGTHVFSPDPRISVNYPSETLSQLIVANGTKEDAKKYRCRSSPQDRRSCTSRVCEEEDAAFEMTFHAIFGKKTVSAMQAMDSAGTTSNVKSSVTISGPQLAFYGMPLELICRANFSSPEAKRDPTISLEWYHNGVRRRTNRLQSGGTFVSSRWVDSHLLESRLLITWTSKKEAGRWNCVERSRMNRPKVVNDSSPLPSMSFDQLNLQIIAPPPLMAFATTATATSPEAVNQKSSKLRRYLHFTEASGRWRKTSATSSATSLSVFTPLPVAITMCGVSWRLHSIT